MLYAFGTSGTGLISIVAPFVIAIRLEAVLKKNASYKIMMLLSVVGNLMALLAVGVGWALINFTGN